MNFLYALAMKIQSRLKGFFIVHFNLSGILFSCRIQKTAAKRFASDLSSKIWFELSIYSLCQNERKKENEHEPDGGRKFCFYLLACWFYKAEIVYTITKFFWDALLEEKNKNNASWNDRQVIKVGVGVTPLVSLGLSGIQRNRSFDPPVAIKAKIKDKFFSCVWYFFSIYHSDGRYLPISS